MNYYIGIDLGTQSIRAALIDIKGSVLGLRSRPQNMFVPQPGYSVQDPSNWWNAICNDIREVLEDTGVKAEEVGGISVCAHMHGCVPVDKDGNLLSNQIQLYCDKRAAAIGYDFEKAYPYESFYEQSANIPNSTWQGFKIAWVMQNQPELYEKTAYFITPKDYIIYKLCSQFVTDPSEGAGTFLMNAENDQWCDATIAKLGLDKSKLPKIYESGEIVGELTPAAAADTGLVAGTKVICGGGDMLCTLLVSGICETQTAADITGTGSNVCYFDEKPILDKRMMNLRHVIPGWVSYGCVDNSGGAYRWFRDICCKKEAADAKKQGISSFALLDSLAKNVPAGTNGLMFFPYMMGERTLGSAYSRGMFIGLTPGMQTGDLVRALLEGIAYEHRRTFEVIEENGGNVKCVYHCGGGANGPLWSQIKADIYGKPVYTFENELGGSIGAAILAAAADGAYTDVVSGARLFTKVKDEYLPQEQNHELYTKLYKQFVKIHDAMQEPFIDIAGILADVAKQ